MSVQSRYDRFPVVTLPDQAEAECYEGWAAIFAALHESIASTGVRSAAIECYPGVFVEPLLALLQAEFPDATIVNVEAAYRQPSDIRATMEPVLTQDAVFGRMASWGVESYFESSSLAAVRAQLQSASSLRIAIGAGAAFVMQMCDLLLHAGVTRWELQRRQRAGLIGNLGWANAGAAAGLLYKNAFFVDWRVGDLIRHELYQQTNWFLDLDTQEEPKMVSGPSLRRALSSCVRRPFRVEPFFDPGPWGGHWMKERFGLPEGPPNYAWCFDCVPEENSLALGFGSRRFRLPAIVLVQEHPQALLGESIVARFGAEFPIRFDLLDTVGGGNLSLQVHPLTAYIRERFGMDYTQDESYYMLECEPGSQLYLGLCNGIDPAAMQKDLEAAQQGQTPFPAERYVGLWPTKKHDHFAIPAGTVHCSGAGNVVLEISATPYIFTFKLWDWGRLGLDGKPRPIHLDHGLKNIQWDRDADWVERELLNQVATVAEEDGWREERTGLHALEFIESRRTWFTGPVPHHTRGNLHVLNLVEGEAALVESPSHAFVPFEVHYGETFIVPACVGAYSIRPLAPAERPLATIKAFVRG